MQHRSTWNFALDFLRWQLSFYLLQQMTCLKFKDKTALRGLTVAFVAAAAQEHDFNTMGPDPVAPGLVQLEMTKEPSSSNVSTCM